MKPSPPPHPTRPKQFPLTGHLPVVVGVVPLNTTPLTDHIGRKSTLCIFSPHTTGPRYPPCSRICHLDNDPSHCNPKNRRVLRTHRSCQDKGPARPGQIRSLLGRSFGQWDTGFGVTYQRSPGERKDCYWCRTLDSNQSIWKLCCRCCR